eukprot:TRINITY_DN15367_c0_g1_i2.p1 TRINITY_DN15367_c0_g1~~TRINITY_DN15367_c0_g1_i2.p1  ORF type:complete len:186 (+),score=15.26 TRINITY_DN15367_c0_g1_i2:136-693(+)
MFERQMSRQSRMGLSYLRDRFPCMHVVCLSCLTSKATSKTTQRIATRGSRFTFCFLAPSRPAPTFYPAGYKPSNMRVTKGEELLTMYNVDGKSKEDRHFCKNCGSRVYSMLNQVPGGMKAVFLQNFTKPNHGADGKIDPRFAPQCHIFYASGTISCYDGLPKFETKRGGNTLPDDYHDKRRQATA